MRNRAKREAKDPKLILPPQIREINEGSNIHKLPTNMIQPAYSDAKNAN